MSSSVPSTLGKYQIIREIARSNDIVYEAYDPLMNRRVALKELAVPHGSTNPQREERVKRFLREAKAAGSLSHPNIMTVYEVGAEGDRHFIAMEFLDGHTLRNELDTHGSLSPDRATEIAIEVLEGLQFAHKSGVVHRDIKPENIQLLSDGRIKLTDFGIARLTFEPNLTMDGQVFGTPSYMSPEQVVGKEIDARSDVFSLGIVLYEMVCGQKPFTGDSVVSITYAIMNREPDRPQTANFALWQVISRALDKSPALRWNSAGEMVEALLEAKNASHSVVLDNPQMVSPYATPSANPYAPQAALPYGASMPQTPLNYPYNPYQPGQQTQVPGQQTTVPPGYMPLPMYYPPPPRQPLIKPETKRFLGRLVITLALLGTLFGLVIVAIWSAGQVYNRLQNQSHDGEVRSQLATLDKTLPLEERIETRKAAIVRIKDPAALREENAILAKDHAALAEHILNNKGPDHLSRAQTHLQAAAEADQDNPAYLVQLGDLLVRTAGNFPDPESRRENYREGSLKYEEALSRPGVKDTDGIADKLAEASLNAALISEQLNDPTQLDYDLRRAERFVVGQVLRGRIEAVRARAPTF